MRDRPHHRVRNFLYGDPARAVPLLAAAFGVGVGAVTGSPGWGAGAWLCGLGVWNLMSPRLVIEDTRLGPVTLTCPPFSAKGAPQICLTFDDGPGPETLEVLDILNEFGVPATFFMIGERVAGFDQQEALRERLRQGGHRVANHSYRHPSFLTLSASAVREEVDTTERLLDDVFGELLLPAFRPPFGYRSERLFAHAAARGLEVLGWSLNSLDFLDGSVEALVERVSEADPGAIVLLHDGPAERSRTVNALPQFLGRLQERGFTFTLPHQESRA